MIWIANDSFCHFPIIYNLCHMHTGFYTWGCLDCMLFAVETGFFQAPNTFKRQADYVYPL